MNDHVRVLIDGEYFGFESILDLERDVSEMFDNQPAIPSEFKGTVKVTIMYIPPENGD